MLTARLEGEVSLTCLLCLSIHSLMEVSILSESFLSSSAAKFWGCKQAEVTQVSQEWTFLLFEA